MATVTSRLDFANAGPGVAMLSTFIVHDAVRRGALSIVLMEYMISPIAMHALHPSTRDQTARTRALIDFLVNEFGGKPCWDRELFDRQTTSETPE